jgi:hypothetical protein
MSTSTKGNNQHEASSRFGKVKPLVIFIIGVICSFGLAKWPIKGEVHWLSVMGQTLQLFGTFTVAWKIRVRIRQHKGDLSLKNVVEWLVNFSGSTFPEPYQDQSQVLLSWISEDKGTSCESSTITKHNLPENDILRLSKTVETLEEKLESFIAADVSEKGSIISRINRQNEVLNHNLKQLKMDLEQKERAGFEYEFIGTLWLILGLIISLISLYPI